MGGILAGAAQAPAVNCPPDDEAALDAAPMPHVQAVLKAGGTLNMLAIGSANLAAQKPGAQPGLPGQVAHALETVVHGLHVNLTLAGRRGLTAGEMVPLLRDELAKKPYRLVLWQTGTVDAVQSRPPEEFYQALADGAAAISAAHADLVLIDMQYSRFLAANANLAPYANAMETAAELPGVALFHRTDLMRAWADDGAIDLEHARRADRAAVAARLHACLGRALAEALVEVAKE